MQVKASSNENHCKSLPTHKIVATGPIIIASNWITRQTPTKTKLKQVFFPAKSFFCPMHCIGDIFKFYVLEMRVGATMHLVALGKFSHNSHSRLTWCPDRRLLASVNSATIILVTRAVANIITLVNIIFVIIKIINIPLCTQTDLLLRSQSPCIPYSRRLFTFWIISIIVVMHCPFTIHNMSCHCIITIIVS